MKESPARSQAALLLEQRTCVVVAGPRPTSQRSAIRSVAMASLVVMASAFSTAQAQSYTGLVNSRQPTSSTEFATSEVGVAQEVITGVVTAVQPVTIQKQPGMTRGTGLGAVIGGAIGNMVKRGNRTANTAAGAVGGGFLGKRLGGNKEQPGLQIFVRQVDDHGRMGAKSWSIVQDANTPVNAGDRVYLVRNNVANGAGYRVIPVPANDIANRTQPGQIQSSQTRPVAQTAPEATGTARPSVSAGLGQRIQNRRATNAVGPNVVPVEPEDSLGSPQRNRPRP